MTGLLLAASQSPAEAQGRRGSPRFRTPVRVHVAPQVRVHVRGWYGSGMYYPWGWGWGGWHGFYPPYGYYPYYGYNASVRIQVEPKNAEVYVDGHLAGMVDDFDGFFQRLHVEPGGREITVYKDGFRSYSERLYLRAGQNYGMRHVLEPLAAGEPNEPRPARAQFAQPDPEEAPRSWPRIVREPVDPRIVRDPVDPEPQVPAEIREPVPSNFGQVAIRVQPADAEILIDDEPWRGPQGAERLVVHLRPGVHRVEIRKEGFDPFVTSIDVKKGETAVLNVSLGRVPGV